MDFSCRGGYFGFVDVAGVAPDVFFGVNFLYAAQKRGKDFLIFRLKRFPAQNGQTGDKLFSQGLDDFVLGVARKLLSVAKIPCHRVKTTGTVNPASRHKKGNPDPIAVSYIYLFNFTVVHNQSVGYKSSFRKYESKI